MSIRFILLKNRKQIYWGLLLPLGALLAYIGSLLPAIIERYYSTALNRILIEALSSASGVFPFSLAEILVLLIAIMILRGIIKWLGVITRNRNSDWSFLAQPLISLLVLVSVLYFLFVFLWGLNYSRLSFAQIAGFTVQPATTGELAQVCESLIERTNLLRLGLEQDQNGVMRLTDGKTMALNSAVDGYEQAKDIYPELGGKFGRPKALLLSIPVSYLGFSGAYFPFTGEANINMAVPDAMLPSTVGHEMAHQRGFAREDEANYIAYLTCNLNPDPNFQYSGNMLAVIISMNTLRQYDMAKFLELQAKYGQGMRNDLNDYALFTKKHDTIIRRFSNAANDLYLKSNRQADGVYSYDRMVNLLIAEFRYTGQLPDR